jgi:roadblock/LC7 domain-containing protein
VLGCVAAHVANMDTRKALTSDSMCAASDMMATLQRQREHGGQTADGCHYARVPQRQRNLNKR